jgi:hypothetical protein
VVIYVNNKNVINIVQKHVHSHVNINLNAKNANVKIDVGHVSKIIILNAKCQRRIAIVKKVKDIRRKAVI